MRFIISIGSLSFPVFSFGAVSAPEVNPRLAPLLFLLALGLVYRATRKAN